LETPLERAPQRFWRAAFPLPWRDSVFREAQSNALDPYLLAALIRQESEWNPRAVSRARAYGLTQVLPATGRQLSRRVGLSRFTTASLYDPDVNLKLGTYYLRNVLQQHEGKWEHALASYNAGKTRTEQWLTWYKYREPAEFVETVPFTETRTYIQVVLRNADVYRRLYGDSRFVARKSP
jgi:soluble lytic murein transglycosylase